MVAEQVATFDCSRAATETEMAICSEYQLSVDNRIIAYLYEKHLNWRKGVKAWWSGDGIEVPVRDIIEDQKKWTNDVRDQCQSNVACLEEVLDLRIDHFLDLVRLERPMSGSYHAVYFSQYNAKVALRLLSGILENISRHGLLPKFSDPEKLYFSLNLPHSTDIDGHEVGALDPITSHFLSENSSDEEQLNFGKFIEINYDLLTTCLKYKSLSDVVWVGDDITEIAYASTGCIEFWWKPNFYSIDGMNFPLVYSRYLNIALDNIDNTVRTFDICSDILQNQFCIDSLVSQLNDLRLKFASELFVTHPQSEITAFNTNSEFSRELNLCKDSLCVRNLFLESISKFDELIRLGGEIPPYCRFGEDGIYRCGEAQLCMAGNSGFQMVRKSSLIYQLDFWEDVTFGRWRKDNIPTPTRSFEGNISTEGTYPCTHDVYSFDGISILIHPTPCGGGFVHPESAMFELWCESENNLCGQETFAYCVSAGNP
jgi:hypothetical protein